MTDKDKPAITLDVLMADVMLRITAIEKLLIDKGIFTTEEFGLATEQIAQKIAKVVMEKVQNSKNMEEFNSTTKN